MHVIIENRQCCDIAVQNCGQNSSKKKKKRSKKKIPGTSTGYSIKKNSRNVFHFHSFESHLDELFKTLPPVLELIVSSQCCDIVVQGRDPKDSERLTAGRVSKICRIFT